MIRLSLAAEDASVRDFMSSFTDVQVQAPVYELPSTKMYCEVAPVARMALMAAWLRETTRDSSMSWYSLSRHGIISSAYNQLKCKVMGHTSVEDDFGVVAELRRNGCPERAKVVC